MKTYENKTIMNEYKKVQVYEAEIYERILGARSIILGSQDALDQETISWEDESNYAIDNYRFVDEADILSGIEFDWMFD